MNMNLTDLANHICEQCGMKDTGDVSAAKMFLQRRLEMIWGTQIWRSSLIEGVMTVSPDGSCTLANTIWVPSRGTLLLPPEFNTVLAVRTSGHALNVASLESYYRKHDNPLDMSGDPTEFQLLKPIAWEFANNNNIIFCAEDATTTVKVSTTADSVTQIANTLTGLVNLSTFTIPLPTKGVVNSVQIIRNASADKAFNLYALNEASATLWPQATIQITIPASAVLCGWNVSPTLKFFIVECTNPDGSTNRLYEATNMDSYAESNDQWDPWDGRSDIVLTLPIGCTNPVISLYNLVGEVIASAGGINSNTATIPAGVSSILFNCTNNVFSFITTFGYSLILSSTDGSCPTRQRIRLTSLPSIATTLRVLGKTNCPVLGDYDTMPINGVEPCLMAFARGDMLLRQRQHGKASMAQNEGTALLAQLARSEAFQQASHHRIVPDNGFGGDDCHGKSHF